MRHLAPFSLALLALLGGCSRLPVTWSENPGAITIDATGFTNAYLIVLSGKAEGPMLRRETPRVWTTIAPAPGGKDVEVARSLFDDTGRATATVSEGQVPSGSLIQAIVISRAGDGFPMAVSDCKAVRWKDGIPSLRSHAIEVLISPAGVTCLGVAVAVFALVLLARVRFEPAGSRGFRVAAVSLVAAYLLLCRVTAPAPAETTWRAEPPLPLWPRPLPHDQARLDPLDRVSTPGFHELVDQARAASPADARIAIRAAGESGEAKRDAWQAGWMLWPRPTEILRRDADPFDRRGLYLILGEASIPRAARVMFRNQAGAFLRLDEGEPR